MSEPFETHAQHGGSEDPAVHAVAQYALEFIKDGDRVGLGSGRASQAFIRALGARVNQDFRVEGVPTSVSSEKLAREVGIPLIELKEDVELDVTVDGADEVLLPSLDMIKGWGGALVRERIVASASKRQVILVGTEKIVQSLGSHGRIPVETIPLALGFVTRQLKLLGLMPTVRRAENAPYITDNGNLILDCAFASPNASTPNMRKLEGQILALAGVVDTGLFLGTADLVLVGSADGSVKAYERVVV